MKVIYSIGSSTHQIEAFLTLLHHFQVEILADVRSFPVSRLSHFRKENLVLELNRVGIAYLYLGKELGGYRKGGYEIYTLTPQFAEGIKLLETAGRRKTTAIMCAEKLPWKCHRQFIGKCLAARGWKVIHIIDEKRVWIQENEK